MIVQSDLDKYLTIQLQTTDTLEDYLDHVWNWITNEDMPLAFEGVIKNCFEASISTFDCARYIMDKFYGIDKKQIKLNFVIDKIVSDKSTLIEKNSIRTFMVTAKMSGEYLMLRAVDRTRTHRGINNYELRKVHYSVINKEYNVHKY